MIDVRKHIGRYRTELRRTPMDSVVHMARETDMDPEYQRGHVWTDRQRSLYIGALIEGRANDSAAIVLYERTYGLGGPSEVVDDLYYEVVDGKQRLTAIVMFHDQKLPAEFRDGTRALLQDMDTVSNRRVRLSVTVALGVVRNLTRAEVIDLYLALNEGGTMHTEAELDRVRRLSDCPTPPSKEPR